MSTRSKQAIVHILEVRCKGCGFCVEFCPVKILAQTKDTNAKGYQLVIVAEPEKCNGCGMCSHVCPEFAIYVETDKGNI